MILSIRTAPCCIAVGIAMLATGCRSHRDDAKSGPEVIYAKAQKSMKDSNYAEAIKQLETLQSRFPFSEPAHQAQIDLIYAYYKNREVDPAIDAADTFIRENPTNPRVDYAYYMKGLVYFERQSNFMERWFNVDLSKRPPVNAKKSFDAFDELLKKYPAQRICRRRPAAHDFPAQSAGRLRAARGALLHEARRLRRRAQSRQVLRRELRRRPCGAGLHEGLVDAYRKLKMTDLAANAERVYADNYPQNAKDMQKKKSWWQHIL